MGSKAKMLLEAGAFADLGPKARRRLVFTRFDCLSLPQLAAKRGDFELLQILLDHGASIDSPAGFYSGGTCLQIAAGVSNIAIVRFFD